MLKPTAMLAILALALAGCQSARNQNSAPAPAPASAAAPAQAAAAPAAGGCTAAVSRFRTLIDTDLATGHTTKAVHAQVTGEINAAAQMCASGNDAGARAAIAASRTRHGYPG